MNRKYWRKILWDRRSRKYAKNSRKIKYNKKYINSKDDVELHKPIGSIYHEVVTKRYTAPTNFSIINNPNETIGYFNTIYDGIFKKLPQANFVIDSSKVENVTVDVLVHLIAIMENMKLIRSMRYSFGGNLPSKKEAETVYTESGFMDYVKSRIKILPNKAKMRIVTGTANSPTISKAVCDFIMGELMVSKQEILFVQKILVELMSNSYYHAYPEDKTNIMFPRWYIYAEHVENKTRVVFTDTGKGISGTIRKRFSERVFNIKDEELIYLAFEPDSFIRTETKLTHRGNGLPGIKDIVYDSPIQSFWVFSGAGGFRIIRNVNGQKKLTKLNFEHRIYGTIVAFEF